ncbi:uncharacterized protein isoform X1 [Leptinotarsa decemlineata]|uniref:uncharacterized protein isoform X1 n=1 Tax=Leptinotarsa decemlineata TaxID=7539 RepID=UPI003D308700
MNHGLSTLEWTIIHKEKSGPGQTWTFAVEDGSMAVLARTGFRPYFGFGQVLFRLKTRAPSQQETTQTSHTSAPVRVNKAGPSGNPPMGRSSTKPPPKLEGKPPAHTQPKAGKTDVSQETKTANISSSKLGKRLDVAL